MNRNARLLIVQSNSYMCCVKWKVKPIGYKRENILSDFSLIMVIDWWHRVVSIFVFNTLYFFLMLIVLFCYIFGELKKAILLQLNFLIYYTFIHVIRLNCNSKIINSVEDLNCKYFFYDKRCWYIDEICDKWFAIGIMLQLETDHYIPYSHLY